MVASPEKTRMMHRMKAGRKRPKPVSAPGRAARPGPILGIDPGLQRTGYGLVIALEGVDQYRVLEAGVVRLNPHRPIEERLVDLEQSLDGLIDVHHPDVLACEQLYAHYRHPRTAIIMAHARGVVLALAARRGLAVVNVAATQVKKLLTGSGRASKGQIQRAVAVALHLPRVPEPDDVADALAVALGGLHVRNGQLRAARAARGGRR
jgi:crossover junction endodeoxyribonuclease RuvC